MIISDGKQCKVKGSPVQLASEAASILHGLRESFHKYLGEEEGEVFFQEVIKVSQLSDEEIQKEHDAMKAELLNRRELLDLFKDLVKGLGE